MNRVHRMLSVVTFCLLSFVTVVFLAPASAAATRSTSPALSPAGGSTTSEPMALASTGFDITVPVIIGLSTLVLGIGFLAWAFLRTGSTDHHH